MKYVCNAHINCNCILFLLEGRGKRERESPYAWKLLLFMSIVSLSLSLSFSFSVEFPTTRQLRLWACSLQDMLNDVTGRYKFEQFCKKQYSSENIKFWQACNDLKLLPLFSIPGSVRLVYEWVNKMGKFCLKIIIIITVILFMVKWKSLILH